MNAVDTNILLYAVDEDEPTKRRLARAFLRQLGHTDEPLLMWQVLGEFLAGLRRWEHQRGYDPRRTRRYFQLISTRMRIEYPNLAVAERSFEFRDRFWVSIADRILSGSVEQAEAQPCRISVATEVLEADRCSPKRRQRNNSVISS